MSTSSPSHRAGGTRLVPLQRLLGRRQGACRRGARKGGPGLIPKSEAEVKTEHNRRFGPPLSQPSCPSTCSSLSHARTRMPSVTWSQFPAELQVTHICTHPAAPSPCIKLFPLRLQRGRVAGQLRQLLVWQITSLLCRGLPISPLPLLLPPPGLRPQDLSLLSFHFSYPGS